MTIGMIQALHCQAKVTENKIATVNEIKNYFRHQGKTVVPFKGYSRSGYQDEKSMLAEEKTILQMYNPAKIIINIGATPDGSGAVYALARKMGFQTTGIVSIKAKEYESSRLPHADFAFYVEDATWGGIIKETH